MPHSTLPGVVDQVPTFRDSRVRDVGVGGTEPLDVAEARKPADNVKEHKHANNRDQDGKVGVESKAKEGENIHGPQNF